MNNHVLSADVGNPLKTMPALDFQFAQAGMQVSAVPPGSVDADYLLDWHLIDCNTAATTTWMAVGSDQLRKSVTPADSVAFVQAGADAKLRTCNPDWALVLEIDPKRLSALAAESLGEGQQVPTYRDYASGGRSPEIARLLLRSMLRDDPDPLFVEGLSLAIVSDTLAGFRDEAVRHVSTRGTDVRIKRAIDYAEAHLSRQIAVAELAAIAGMSPSWFANSFAATIGQPVHAYIRERRLDRARILVADKRLSLQEIAYACGFSDQPHMTRQFKHRFGTTPAKARSG